MIRRNELNKILQLIDAGILISDQEIINHIDGLPLIVDNEIFSFDYKTNKITNSNNGIDLYIEDITSYVDKINTLSNIRISKNNIQVSWELYFTDVSISIEDVCIDQFSIGSNMVDSIETINTLLSNEFKNIKEFILEPTGIIPNTKIEFSKNPNFLVLKSKFLELTNEQEYLKFIEQTRWDFGYSIKLKYTKTPVIVSGGTI